ncbi:helix-turn-helix domain-containing protein [Pseudomonas costantinii]|uniref:helix-turn-helix domain-containing protein n=1 Tax=Pseudomonas costantinii TaxID=168469 RepID=UPI0015A03EF9|nr:helix-turn-helix domain-containing protein [Pseudomonas costantinii]NVZ71915.1 helix-turn-helix domain-containing protein [Pseudomonas costantinii]
MTANALLEIRRASTQDTPLEQRLEFWENYNSSILVGLKCSSYSPFGFTATQDNVCLERLRVANIGGNEHVVERDRSMVRAAPKESIFVSLVLGNQSFFYQDNGCNLLQPGELVIYRTDKPYVFGFSGPMRQLIFDIPQDDFAEHCLRDFKGPLKLGAETPVQRLLVRSLGERTQGFFDAPREDGAGRFQEEAYNLLASIISDHTGEHRASALSASYLLAAKQHIQEHLDDPSLSCEQVAAAAGISSRHLARLFAQEGGAPSRYLQEKRLERARQLLASPRGSRLDIAEIAYRHGFSSQAHFARAFKGRFGMTPSEARAR